MKPVQGPPGRATDASRLSVALFKPLEVFLATETRSGALLMLATVAALVTANSPWADTYFAVWDTPLTIGVGEATLAMPLLAWINDFLMAAFFLVVGLEVKRELLIGELNSPRKAALPLVAALGGMVGPALLYVAVAGRQAPSGWGVPMATDIAFAIGVARLLGARVPAALLVFLTAFAIADDLGAVLVIALFYGHDVAWSAVAAVAALVALLFGMNRAGVRLASPYVLVGLPLWLAMHHSGVHATIAGVLLGLCVPSRSGASREAALASADDVLESVRGGGDANDGALQAIESHVDRAQSPLENLEHGLHPYVAYAILPLFAFANAGIALGGMGGGALFDPITLGIAVGLLFGKPVGILAASWLAIRAGVAELPRGVVWRHMFGAGVLGGIGFTMSLFVAALAFPGSEAQHVAAKLGILLGSGLSAVVGLVILARRPATHAASVPRPG